MRLIDCRTKVRKQELYTALEGDLEAISMLNDLDGLGAGELSEILRRKMRIDRTS